MDTQQQSQQTVNDDQELAKVLAGINRETSPTEQSNLMSSLAEESSKASSSNNSQQEDTGAPEPLPDDIAQPPVEEAPATPEPPLPAEPQDAATIPMIQHRQMAQAPTNGGGAGMTEQAPEVSPVEAAPVADPIPEPSPQPIEPSVVETPHPVDHSEDTLDSIKARAMSELSPLVDKLSVSPEEKFDTLLLLIRSTDDKNLIEPAYHAAAAISDDARRAKALLDVIKEIDFLNNPQ